jgi:pyruvate dehydrogenase E1 component alpha subunit
MAMDRSTQLWLYEMMFRIRRFEEWVIDLFARGKIPGFLHSYLGEESVATGACAHLRKDDYIISTHRGHGHILAKGARTDLAMAELFGKRTGYCNGKGGSMHIADPDIGILGANGIVGAGIVIANGAGLSAQYRGTDQVCVCFFGDGASNQGTFHEGLNLASVWKLPVVFVCENNAYAMSTQPREGLSVQDVSVRAAAYGIPGVTVNGNDVLAVYEAAGVAIENARAGKGPALVEAKTYRIRGHYEGDPQTYRTREEVDEWRTRCPILCYRASLLESGVSEDELKSIDARVEAELLEAVEFADKSPLPDVSEARHGIFTEVAEVA